MHQLDAIFSPQSVAVVGASTTPGKVGHDIFVNILQGDYQGTLYPVNPRARYVRSVRAYPSISELPEPVDLAIICTAAEIGPECSGTSRRKRNKRNRYSVGGVPRSW